MRPSAVVIVIGAVTAGLLPAVAVAADQPASGAHAGPEAGVHRLWRATETALAPTRDSERRRVAPTDFAAFTLDRAAMVRRLDGAPAEDAATEATPTEAGALVVAVPDPDGALVDFAVTASAVMEPGLAAAHPEIRTYAGRGVQDPTATIRLDTTPTGFHASVRAADRTSSWYVDPAYHGNDRLHVSYYSDSLPEAAGPRRPDELDPLDPALAAEAAAAVTAEAAAAAAAEPGAPVTRRTYRLALVTDPSYARYFGAANVLAEKVTLVNRVNQVYNDDLAVHLVLVDGTERLSFDTAAEATGADGPCGTAPCFTPTQLNRCTGNLMDRNRIVVGQLIGAGSYDVGHIGLGLNGGGIAALGVVGGDGKARGCTGLPTPEGDFYAVDYVSHEIGHQFAGNHTFNGSNNACYGSNRNPGTSVEPGSGSSVMAYAGICDLDNLQPHSDPYFSQRSQDEITGYVTRAPARVDEVQNVSLRGFDEATDAFALGYGARTSDPIPNTALGYNTSALATALTGLTGDTATVTGWGGGTALGAAGFQVTFNGPALRGKDVPSLTVLPAAGDATGFTGETTRGGSIDNRGAETVLGNHAPVVTAPVTRTIPVQTPFALAGTATDADGDALTYLWEQDDVGGAIGISLVDNRKTRGPLFRQFGTGAQVTGEGTLESPSPGLNQAGRSPGRVFPDMTQILASSTNAVTGTCPRVSAEEYDVPAAVVDCYSEFLPTASYAGSSFGGQPSLNFRLTARDGDQAGGGVGSARTRLLLDTSAGPFLVGSRNQEGQPAAGGAAEVLTWSVAGTDAAHLAPEVRISLSTDGGETFPVVLAARTANDGNERVTWPRLSTSQARIKIEAVGNYFFDVNDASFTIVATPETTITAAPREGGFVRSDDVRVSYAADAEGAAFDCTLDGAPVDCAEGSTTLPDLGRRTHIFAVAAVAADGTVDPTPARRIFTVPRDDRALRTRGAWQHRRAAAAYLGTYSQTRTRGAALSTRVSGATQVAIVATRGPAFGAVKVYLGDRLLDTVRLDANRLRTKRIIPVATFARPRTGTLRIVSTSARLVRIEGLGVVSR